MIARNGIKYKIGLQHKNIDGEFLFVASVAEFPHLETYERTWQNAVQLLWDAIDVTIDDFNKRGKEYPEPNNTGESSTDE